MRVSVQGPLGRAGQSQKSPAVSVTIQRPSSTPDTVHNQPSSGAASAAASHEPIGSNAGVSVIEFYKPLGVLLCLRCPAAIKPSRDQVQSHYRKKHSLVGQALKDVLAFAESSQLACVAEGGEHGVRDPDDVELPPDGSLPIPSLDIYPGWSCTGCRHLERSLKRMSLHQSRSCRGTGNSASGEGSNVIVENTGSVEVALQTLTGGNRARYWIVQTPSPEEAKDDGLLHAVRACEGGILAEAAERRSKVDVPGGAAAESNWVRFMMSAKHLQGKDKRVIRLAAAAPVSTSREKRQWNGDEARQNQRLRILADSFTRQVDRCIGRIDRVPTETLMWLAGKESTKPGRLPFSIKETSSTMDFYSKCWQRYLCYCARMFGLGRDAARANNGIVFTDDQWNKLGQVVRRLDTFVSNSPEGDAEGGHQDRQHATCGGGFVVVDAAGLGEEEPPSAACEELNPDTEVLDRAVFDFCVCSIEQKILADQYQSPLLHFAAALGIRPDHSWEPATAHTRFFAGILWCARLLILEHVFGAEPDDGGGPDDETRLATVERFQQYRREWLVEGSYSVVSRIINWMTYGRGYRSLEYGQARIIWSADGRTLNYLGDNITVAAFQATAQAAVREAEAQLDELMGGQWAAISQTILLRDIADSLVYEAPGRSFATNRKNSWLRPGAERLTELVGAMLWRKVEGRYECRREKVREYMSCIERFRRSLLVTTHIWGGQPGRGPEVMKLKHYDTEQLSKNIFVFDGQVVIITDHDKSKAQKGGFGRKVARFLPERPSRLMVAFIAWVLPFERVLHRLAAIQGPSDSVDADLWKSAKKQPWGTPELSSHMRVLSGEHIGAKLDVEKYRHVAVAMGRRIKELVKLQNQLDDVFTDSDDEMDDPSTGERQPRKRTECAWDMQTTHCGPIARGHYAVNVQFPHQLQPELMSIFQEISGLWHGFLARTDGAFGESKRRAGDAEPESRRASQCHCGGRDVAGAAPIPLEAPTTGPMLDTQHVDDGLRRMFGQDARWKSPHQQESMYRIMEMRSDGIRGNMLISVLPTGGGKSVLFMLPALLEEERGPGGPVSIVVVPFVSLAEEIVSKARGHGIDCMEWRSDTGLGERGRQRDARLVVVVAETAVGDAFTAYAEGIRGRGLLSTIFLDECHTLITDVGYREQLALLPRLHRLGCPLVMLTATLPLSMEPWFRQQMLATEAAIIRAPTARANIRYSVKSVAAGHGAVDVGVLEAIEDMEAHMGPSDLGVVYCRSIWHCKSLAARMGCVAYNGGLSRDERADLLLRWASSSRARGASRWIVATTALGTGVDVSGIVSIIHAGSPFGLVDYAQQTGRGGRRVGQVVNSVIVTDGRAVREDIYRSDVDHMNRTAMDAFIHSAGCRRRELGRFFDGLDRSCSDMACEPCDACLDGRSRAEADGDGTGQREPQEISRTGHLGGRLTQTVTRPCHPFEAGGPVNSSPSTMSRYAELVQGEARRFKKLSSWLDKVQHIGCSVCYVEWHILGARDELAWLYRHPRGACSVLRQKDFDRWQARIGFKDLICCWQCGLPYAWCEERRNVDGSCLYRNVVLPLVMQAQSNSTIRVLVEQRFAVDASDEAAYISWVQRTRTTDGRRITNAIAVWEEIVCSFC